MPFVYNSPQEVIAAARLFAREAVRNEAYAMGSPSAVRRYLRDELEGCECEEFVVVFLDSQNRVICAEAMFRGTINQTSVYPREVVKAALCHNAAAVILAHNHPSGIAEPSRADEQLTGALKTALKMVDVAVLDHFIVAPGSEPLSFAEKGLL